MENSLFTSNSKTVYYIRRLFIFVCILFLIDRGLGLILRELHTHTFDGSKGLVNYRLSESSDVYIFGSSRAHSHYDSRMFESELRMTTMNAGVFGSKMSLHYGLASLVLSKHTPLMFVLDVSATDFTVKNSNLHVLRPYYGDSVVASILDEEETFVRLKNWSAVYPYNSEIATSIYCNLFRTNPLRDNKGYLPLSGNLSAVPREREEGVESPSVDQKQFDYLFRFASLAKRKNCRIVFVISPIAVGIPPSQDAIYRRIRAIADSASVPIWDYSELIDQEQSPAYFRDLIHLNSDGARLFSDTVISRLQREFIR